MEWTLVRERKIYSKVTGKGSKIKERFVLVAKMKSARSFQMTQVFFLSSSSFHLSHTPPLRIQTVLAVVDFVAHVCVWACVSTLLCLYIVFGRFNSFWKRSKTEAHIICIGLLSIFSIIEVNFRKSVYGWRSKQHQYAITHTYTDDDDEDYSHWSNTKQQHTLTPQTRIEKAIGAIVDFTGWKQSTWLESSVCMCVCVCRSHHGLTGHQWLRTHGRTQCTCTCWDLTWTMKVLCELLHSNVTVHRK